MSYNEKENEVNDTLMSKSFSNEKYKCMSKYYKQTLISSFFSLWCLVFKDVNTTSSQIISTSKSTSTNTNTNTSTSTSTITIVI